jgi:hypothetical protein
VEEHLWSTLSNNIIPKPLVHQTQKIYKTENNVIENMPLKP